mmetsp:Transcript_5205/g.17061  ORF Transcript_5205/g.17061 Transcript_5205/m.17061 type:complete len:251 (+) Transcript_5205:50-802(+)
MRFFFRVVLLSVVAPNKGAWALSALRTTTTTRRGALWTFVLMPPGAASAFENAVPEAVKFADKPKRHGPRPTGLGLEMRDDVDSDEPELKVCGGAPNCFSTTPDEVAPEHFVERWVAPKTLSRDDAIAGLRRAIQTYKPGQQGIDGGGFLVVADRDGYFRVIFESLKNGYYDDLEFALNDDDDATLKVRSSSRVGYLDYGVNAKRLNALAATLRASGWTAPDITPATHPDYFRLNSPKQDQVPASSVFTR